MNRIAIITWLTYRNYGTLLQAYALQYYLKNKGYNNAILNDKTIIPKPSKKKALIRRIALFIIRKRKIFNKIKLKNDALFEQFKRRYIQVDYNVEDLLGIEQRYDTFICGSDQIWNPFSLDNPNAGFYFASFTTKKKIAYAPSFGVSEIPRQYNARLEDFTIEFAFLSAREKQGVDILHELTGKEVVRVVDPTLLLDKEQWNMLLPQKSPCKEKYILAYFLTPNAVFLNSAKEYAKRRGLKLKMFFTDKNYYGYDCDLIIAGPIEFLHYVRHAEILFTDSFHGSIFASIFHIQFFTFRRFKQTDKSQNSRVENLLEMMGISERLLSEDSCDQINKLLDIDFTLVDDNLAPFIRKSKEYLEKALQ